MESDFAFINIRHNLLTTRINDQKAYSISNDTEKMSENPYIYRVKLENQVFKFTGVHLMHYLVYPLLQACRVQWNLNQLQHT